MAREAQAMNPDIKFLHDISRTLMDDWLQVMPSFVGQLTPLISIFPGTGNHSKPPTEHIDRSYATHIINKIGNSVDVDVSPERLQLTYSQEVHEAGGQDLLKTSAILGLRSLDTTSRRISLFPRHYQVREGRHVSEIGNPMSSDEIKRFWRAVLKWDSPVAPRDRLLASLCLWDGFALIQALTLRYRDVMDQGVVRRAIAVRHIGKNAS